MKTIWSITLLVTLLFFTPVNIKANYFSDFDKQELMYQSAFILTACIDWQQTKTFRALNKEEANPLLGKRPSQQKVDFYIFSGLLLHTLTTYALPKKYRLPWVSFFIITEIRAISANSNKRNTGIKLNIRF